MLGTRVDGYDQSGDEVVARELGREGGDAQGGGGTPGEHFVCSIMLSS